jgi:ABC-type transporter Mla MlaB component
MSLILAQQQPHWLIRFEGQIGLASAAELQSMLVAWLTAETDLELDLERVEEVDVTILQLLWATGREALQRNKQIVGRASEAAKAAACDAGFDRTAGFPKLD